MRTSAWLGLLVTLFPVTVLAHHSFAEFDTTVTEEYDGEIQSVFWRNPHVRMSIMVRDDNGEEVLWNMEAQDINTLGRLGVRKEMILEGQHVRFAGFPSRRQDNYLALTHLLFDSGTEIVMRLNRAPRWSVDALGGGNLTGDPADISDAVPQGIFRVWSTLSGQSPPDFTRDPPLTSSARTAYEAFDPVTDDPVLQCATPGMPEAMTYIGPHPIEFVDNGDSITLNIESDDITRIIHMTDEVPEIVPVSPLGYSTGTWMDDLTLVVRTVGVNWPYTKLAGLVAVPQSTQSVYVEYFRLSDDQKQLSYSFSITDPATFTRQVDAENYITWQWLAGASIQPYECTLE